MCQKKKECEANHFLVDRKPCSRKRQVTYGCGGVSATAVCRLQSQRLTCKTWRVPTSSVHARSCLYEHKQRYGASAVSKMFNVNFQFASLPLVEIFAVPKAENMPKPCKTRVVGLLQTRLLCQAGPRLKAQGNLATVLAAAT